MKKLLTFLTLLTLFFTTAGAESMVYTTEAVNGTNSPYTVEGTLTGTPSNLTVTASASATYKSFSNGVQLTGNNSFTLRISGMSSDYRLKGITLQFHSNKDNGTGTMTAKLGNTSVADNLSIPKRADGTDGRVSRSLSMSNVQELLFDDQTLTITVLATSNSLYVENVTITYEEGSTPVTPRVETPVITLSQDAPYYVGDNVTASITCGTEGAAIVYSLDNGTTWNPYSTAVEIPSATAGTVTIKAKATKADYLDSYEATQTITITPAPTVLTNLAAVNALADGATFTFNAQTVVLGKYNKQLYIVMPDNSAGTLVFGGSNWSNDYTYGKVVSSGWSGEKTTYNTKPEVTSPTDFSLAGTTSEVTPIEITSNDNLTLANFGRYAVIRNVQVAADGSFSELTTYDQFHLSFTDFEAGRYDVYGVIGWNNGVGQFMPLQYEEHVAAYTITVNQPAAGGSISADAETADAGEEITLTATPAAGYQLASWTVKDADDNDVTVTNNKFTMPASNVTVTAAFEAIKYAVNVNVTPANSGEVWVQGGCTVEDNVSVSTVGTTVTVKLHSNTNYQVDGISVVDADNNEITATLTSTVADGNTYTFVMPASAVTVTGKFHAYVPDVYFLAGELSNWDNGVKMTYDSENNKYNLRVYFSDEYGYFRFRAGDNTYASGAEGDWWGLNGSTAGETATLYQGSTKRFRVPAGIYDIEVGQVFDDPTTSSNPNWWGQTTVKVTKVEPTLTFTPAAGEIVSGSSVSVSSNLYELLSAINSNITENDVINMVKTDGDYAASVTLDAAATVTGRAKYGYIEQTATAEYTIMQENTSNKYQLSTTLTAGKKYIIVSEGKNDIMGAYNSSKSRYDVATASGYSLDIDNHIATLNEGSDVSVFTLGGSEGAWTLTDGNIYLSYSGSGNELHQSETASSNNEKWSITFDDSNAIIENMGNEGRHIRHNSQSGIYACYTSAQTAIQLYQQTEEAVTPKVATPVITPGTGTYAEAKDVEITCSTPGATIWYKYGNMTDYAEYTEALTISENTTLSAYASKDGYNNSDEATATYTFSELSDEIFTLVTSEDQLIEGNEYIIVAATDTYKPALGAIESRNGTPANGYTFETAGDYSVLTLAAESDVNIFTLGKVEVTDPNDKFYWTFKDKDGNFLYADVSGGAIDTDNQSNYSHVYKINIGEGTHYNNYATIQGSANYQIEYRTDSEIFRHYACSNVNQTGNVYKKVLLYTRGVQQTPIMTLADICKYGVTTEGKNEYIIADKLQAVYAYTKGGNSLLWCKDLDNKSIVPTTIHSGQIDFMREPGINTDTEGVHNGQQGPWDQSNWIVLQFTNPTGPNNIDQMLQAAQDKFIKPGTIKGKLVDDENYILKMDLDQLDLVTQADPDYDEEPYNENVYCPANFLPENLNIHDGIENGDGAQIGNVNYFFMNPKVQEICYITYAQWDNDLKYFSAPSSSGIDGAFQVGWVYQDQPALESGTIYKFHAVVHRVGKEYGPQNPVSTKDDDTLPYYANITVLPIDLTADSEVVTSINTVETGNGEVKSVKYVNVAGMVSDVPFQGVNIVVTEYSDGSRSTSKMLRK